MAEFKAGDTIYLISGAEAEYVAVHPNSGHIVLEVMGTDDDGETLFSDPIHTRQVFAEAPIPRINEEIRALEKRREELKKEIDRSKQETLRANAEAVKTLDALKKSEQLKHIVEFMEGKITHVVVTPEYGDIDIVEWKDALMYKQSTYDRMPTKMKLLTLFGDSSGNLSWKLSQYSDGSGQFGSTGTIVGCISFDEAKAVLRITCESRFEAWRKDRRLGWNVDQPIKALRKFGLNVPQDVEQAVEEMRIKNVQDRIDKATADLHKVQQELSTVTA